MTEASSPPCLSAEDLAQLAGWLRSQGFRPATQQCVWAQHLLVRLALEGRLPADPRDLTSHLGPIFCGTPEQQRRFSAVFAQWLTLRFALPPLSAPAAPVAGESHTRQWRWLPWVVGGTAFAVVFALLGWHWDRSRPRELPGIVAADVAPLPQGTVQWIGNVLRAESPYDTQGNFVVRYRRRDLPLKISVAAKSFTAPSQELRSPVPDRLTFTLTHIDSKIAPGVVAGSSPIPTTRASPSPEVKLVRVIQWPQPLDWPRYLSAATPFGLFGAWLAWSHWRRRPTLQRRLSQTPPNLREIHLSGGVRYLLPGLGVRQLARELRRRRIVASRELDTSATLHASLRRGGLFTPVFGSRAEPDYLVLIDRASFADHQARLADEIVLTLQFGDVSIERFYYDRDPRRCQRETRNVANSGIETFTLTELAARFPDHRVLVFSDGTGFFDRFTGEPVPWLDQLGGWSEKVVLTPEVPARWGRREWTIERLGFTLLPLSRAGLALLGDLFREQPRPTFSTSTTAIAATPLFATEPTRWLERHPPRPEIIERLCAELRAHLGSAGFQWLAACAVYPEIHWGLTLRLGSSLPGCAPQFEALLPRLARLVWLRECYLPDWLRAGLLAGLDRATQQQVRLLLQELLAQTVAAPHEAISLQIAVQPSARDRNGWRYLRDMRARITPARMLSAAARTSEADSPLRDYVFLRFMSGEDAVQLTVKAPHLLLRLLFPQGVRWFGVRRAVGLAGCVAASIALFAATGTDFRSFARSVAISPDNSTLAAGGTDGSIRIWNMATGLRIGSPLPQRGFIHSVAFSPDGTRLVSASDEETARIWDTSAGQPGLTSQDLGLVVTGAAFSPDGTRVVVTAGYDTLAQIFDTATAQRIGSPLQHNGTANRAIFSPDGTRVVTISHESSGDTVWIWDAATQQSVGPPWRGPGPLISAAFNRDGTRVITASRDETQIWDAASGQPVGPPLPHEAAVTGATFSPDGTRVVTLHDNTARIWDTTTGQPIGPVLQHPGMVVTSAAFSRDGTRVVTASGDGEIYVWSIAQSTSGQPHALLIGCNYPTRTGQTAGLVGALTNVARRIDPGVLANPVRDMRALEKILTEKYGFAVTTLEDPTLEQVRAAFRSPEVLSASDTFVLALTGHGMGDAKSGFTFPLDSELKTPALTQPEIGQFLNSLPSRQALVLVDASEGYRLIDSSPANTRKADSTADRSRRVLASSSQTTPNPTDGTPGKGSPFVLSVLEALTAARGSFSGQQLFDAVKRSLAAQKEAEPSYGPLKQSDQASSDFHFPPKLDAKSQPAPSARLYMEGGVVKESKVRTSPTVMNGGPISPKSIEQRVREIVLDELGVEENLVKPEASFIDDFGADNEDLAKLIQAFEKEFKRELSGNIPAADAARLRTVGDVINYIRSRTTK